jgi:hypothetical protein
MSEQTNSPRDPEDPMARKSGAVSEDYQAVTTDQDPDMQRRPRRRCPKATIRPTTCSPRPMTRQLLAPS